MKNHTSRGGIAALALGLALSSTHAAAETAAQPAAKALPAPTGSLHLRCDGRPNNVTAGETMARLVGAVTLLGIFAPASETADPKKRLFGADGVAACDSLLVAGEAGEGNSERRIQLQLARALHRIEMKDFSGAISDVGALETAQAAIATTPEYKLGTGLAVKHVEALALAGMGKPEAAADKALEISEAAPYDLFTALRVSGLVELGGRYGAREKAYYDRFVKLMPVALLSRATARQYARDYRGAAQDYDLLGKALDSYLEQDQPDGFAAQSALLSYLAGDHEAGAVKEAAARAYVDKQVAAGKTPASQIELLDLANIVKLADKGDIRQARLLFAGRTKWTAPSAPALADMAERLRKGAAQDDLIGLLAKQPGEFLTEERDKDLALINAAGEKGEKRFGAMAPAVSRAGFDRFAGNVWRKGNSRYFGKKPNEKTQAWSVNTMRDGGGVESGYALLLASALEAKKRGSSHFALYPLRLSVSYDQVRLGGVDNERIYEDVAFDADRVIADLAPILPAPVVAKK